MKYQCPVHDPAVAHNAKTCSWCKPVKQQATFWRVLGRIFGMMVFIGEGLMFIGFICIIAFLVAPVVATLSAWFCGFVEQFLPHCHATGRLP